ncbi:CENP-S associating centromere protein X-domain-containing protein [Aspergillus coremiiformis]|uniref:CENP-S associating centromere protein X-domain-containing protein n=1 Tax=Aspergillus coremiiformis TaxID=138285 RepID=A0A5N6YZN5_9EURO|nr:CENP-S associating centromere protein X-domain-containing protein [Aspergillus coremiiformis]
MPPERQTAQKRRQLPFKPPSRQPSTSAGPSTSKPKAPAKTKANATASASKTRPENSASPTASDSESNSTHTRSRSPSEEPEYILAEITNAGGTEIDVLSSEPAIPAKLLTKIVHHHFKNQKTKIAKDANGVVAKYVDVFVREALARAAFERAEGNVGLEREVGDEFLEVEDLEKMAPQLVLDF